VPATLEPVTFVCCLHRFASQLGGTLFKGRKLLLAGQDDATRQDFPEPVRIGDMRYFALFLLLSMNSLAGEDASKLPLRKPLEFSEQDDVTTEVFSAAVKRLYDEYVSEDRRMAAVFKPDNSVSMRTNHKAIIKDMAELMWRDNRMYLEALFKMPEQTVDWPQWENRQSTVNPEKILWNVLNVFEQRVRRDGGHEVVRQLKKNWDALNMLLDRPKPPDADEWRLLQGAAKVMRAHISYLSGNDKSIAARLEFSPVSFLFNNASLADILNATAVQSDLNLTFEPPELKEEIIKIVVEGRMACDNESARDALKKLLEPRDLSYRSSDDPKKSDIVIFRNANAKRKAGGIELTRE
jgi:hypothetical protein